jgi:ketosteroid isomerase-like protein
MDDAEILAANERFYTAFAERDVPAMEAAWAVEGSIACIHPGWPPIRGRTEVLASWRSIFEHDESPPIRCENPTVIHKDDAIAIVVCRERIGGTVLVATNVLAHEAGGWRLVHHHASGLARVPATPPIDPELLPN